MKILFVSSGNVYNGISPIVLNQGKSLENAGMDVEFFTIVGKGFKGYIKNIRRLRSHLQTNTFDIIHAHYWLSGIIASLAGAKPLIVSLMGTEAHTGRLNRTVIRYFSRNVWGHTIAKSIRIREELNLANATVLPNGIDFNRFKPVPREEAKKVTGLVDGQFILFVSDPSRSEKNYSLAEEAVRKADIKNARLFVVNNKPHDLISHYMHAGDVLLLTSLWEGSPNVIKEAMACGLPIVSTDVGDIREVIADTEGCYIITYDPDEAADKLKHALHFGRRTNGREKIRHLDEKNIAKKLTGIYSSMVYGK
jgi:teichuronic acid biosynthesis glycosyltransferase TuaC